ncbi:hypothetical protein C0J52_21131 [Blattella germanica]|nr:hypothetical protein C0J52_21131 [Blattella germanica]
MHHHHHHHHHHGCHAANPTRDVGSSTGVVTSHPDGPPPTIITTVTNDTGGNNGGGSRSGAPRASPEVTDIDPLASPKRPTGGLLRVPSSSNGWGEPANGSENLLSPTAGNNQQRRPSSVMFSDVVLFHGGSTNGSGEATKNIVECGGIGSGMVGTEAMTCQELLALSGVLNAALPTGPLGLGTFFSSLSKGGKLEGKVAVVCNWCPQEWMRWGKTQSRRLRLDGAAVRSTTCTSCAAATRPAAGTGP